MKNNWPNLKKIRLQNEMTQQELSEKSGVPQPTISDLENGFGRPYPNLRQKLGAALGVDPDLLFQEEK